MLQALGVEIALNEVGCFELGLRVTVASVSSLPQMAAGNIKHYYLHHSGRL